jgi:acyl-CoA synthetase (AMP-forming)/AMP-acid ligase II
VPVAGRAAGVEESAVRGWARERLPGYKVPKRVIVRDELPRNALGKVTKAALVADLVASEGPFSTG